MKVGIISGTHVPYMMKEPPAQVRTAFQGVELILHAGDITGTECLDWLEQIAPVEAVEPSPVPEGDPRLADRRVIDVAGRAIALCYDIVLPGTGGEPYPGTIAMKFPAGQSMADALESLFGRKVDAVVFGHTHVAVLEQHQGIWFINPGSPSFPYQSRRLGTVALLDILPDRLDARLVDLKEIPE